MGIGGLGPAFLWVNKGQVVGGGICDSDLSPVAKGSSLQLAVRWNKKGRDRGLTIAVFQSRGLGKVHHCQQKQEQVAEGSRRRRGGSLTS